MGKEQCSVLFLGKAQDENAAKAAEFCRANFTTVKISLGQWGDPWPGDLDGPRWDCIISYLSRWVVPARLLNKSKIAINFHPGPPEYPGYGCNNFAVYEGAKVYGVTCHHMARRVDTGSIVAVRRFPVLPTDNAATLLRRAYDFQLVLFYEMITRIVQGQEFGTSDEKWTRKPFTRKEFAELARIAPDMNKEEVEKRVRATNMGIWKPTVELHGFVFELRPQHGD